MVAVSVGGNLDLTGDVALTDRTVTLITADSLLAHVADADRIRTDKLLVVNDVHN